MRSHSLHTILIALAAIVLIGCTAAGNKVTKIGQSPTVSQKATPETVVSDGAPRITIAELQEKIKKDEVFILDVRNQASFDAGHIPGSKLIPSGEILNHLDELPKDKLIVTYCS
ncbi:MAG TPA: rhodanese-like domain-containing protein [Pyrinomonadaceae bacterium]|jgi:3-mercaptopyruvate sulfurtransferase SseA